jgi:hypothetical protein
MVGRIAFILVAAFWVTMNVLLWRAEYGSHNAGIEVPLNLVCRKILTAPDNSMLDIFQDGQRIGFCQLTTGVGEEMAELNDESPPPKNLPRGYKITLDGNVILGNFTNRLRFDGGLKFAPNRAWREFTLKLNSHLLIVEIHSVATNQTVHLKITDGYAVIEHNFAFADLQNPNTLQHAFGGNFGGDFWDEFDLPAIPQLAATFSGGIQWEARRVNVLIGRESVSVYRLRAKLFDRFEIVIYVSTLGEILRVELPGNIKASLDEWSQP